MSELQETRKQLKPPIRRGRAPGSGRSPGRQAAGAGAQVPSVPDEDPTRPFTLARIQPKLQ
jgi:hypothetical protein